MNLINSFSEEDDYPNLESIMEDLENDDGQIDKILSSKKHLLH